MSSFDSYVIDEQQKRELAQAYGEYQQECREHGIASLDFTAWQERMEAA